jgi:hypothetical protein
MIPHHKHGGVIDSMFSLLPALFSQTVVMDREDVFSDPHLKAQFSEGNYPQLFMHLADD